MPFTELDEKTALLVIDLQMAAVNAQLAHPVKDVIANVTSLMEAFREHRLPIVLVNVAGTPAGRNERGAAGFALSEEMTRLIGELGHHPDNVLITKNAWSAFSGTGLTDKLHAAGVTQVVITGIATSVGVESTARDAHGDGFHVSLPVDAMTDPAANSHDHSVTHIFPQLAETAPPQNCCNSWRPTRSA
jgi:nicotinamidase-related amidase